MSPAHSLQLTQAYPIHIYPSTALTTTPTSSSGVDMQDYEGVAIFIAHLSALGGTITAMTIDSSDTSGGTYTTASVGHPVTGSGGGASAIVPGDWVTFDGSAAGANKVLYLCLNVSELKRWVRFSVTFGTSGTVSCSMIGFKKSR